jgi:hypothetical protein
LYRGVQFADGTTESVPLGVFIVTAVAVADGPDGVKLAITGADRSLKVARAKWKDDSYYIAAGTAKETAIQGILLDRYPTVSFIPTATGQTLGPLYPTQGMTFGTDSTTYSDPWRTCMEIARSAGMDLYFDEVGVCRMRSIPDPDTAQVVATYTDTTDAVLLSVDRSLETDDTYNGVIATGEGSNLALGVRGEAWDDNAASPTYRKTYGEVPYFYSSPNLFTVSDCTVAAQAELRKRIGATEKITWGQVVNPAHDVYDVISMTRTPSGIVSANIVLDIIEVPLAPTDPMRATARARRFS